jgi:predicted transporter
MIDYGKIKTVHCIYCEFCCICYYSVSFVLLSQYIKYSAVASSVRSLLHSCQIQRIYVLSNNHSQTACSPPPKKASTLHILRKGGTLP